jgi:hypothetical protein
MADETETVGRDALKDGLERTNHLNTVQRLTCWRKTSFTAIHRKISPPPIVEKILFFAPKNRRLLDRRARGSTKSVGGGPHAKERHMIADDTRWRSNGRFSGRI